MGKTPATRPSTANATEGKISRAATSETCNTAASAGAAGPAAATHQNIKSGQSHDESALVSASVGAWRTSWSQVGNKYSNLKHEARQSAVEPKLNSTPTRSNTLLVVNIYFTWLRYSKSIGL